MKTRLAVPLGLLALTAGLAGGVALAWWSESHPVITEAAFAALPADMPEFFRKVKLPPWHRAAQPGAEPAPAPAKKEPVGAARD